MKKKILLSIFILMLIFIIMPTNIVFAEQKDNTNTTAKGMAVIDAESKRVLYSKNSEQQLPMASTTKIMTAIIAIENTSNLTEKFMIDNRAVGIEGTSIYLQENEEMSMMDLLYGLMLASGNDCACAIAYKIGDGNINNFVNLMNQKCIDLSLQNTHFDNPHGLDSKTHYTSAYDLAVITAYAMKNETFTNIVSTKIQQLPSQNGNRIVRNKQKLLWTLNGCEGVKTGFTDNALRCCVTSVKRNNFRIICVVLNCNDMFEESQKLIEKAYNEFEYCELCKPNTLIDNILVNDGIKESVGVYNDKGFMYPLRKNEQDKITMDIKYEEKKDAPIKKHDEVGDIKIYFDKDLIFFEKIYTIEDVEKQDLVDKLKDIVEKWY